MSKRKRKARRLSQRKKVQKRFKARVAAGKSGLTGGAKGTRTNLNKNKPGMPDTSTIGKYRAAQREQVSSAAAARNKTFQANRNLTAAGGTSAQVARDNAMYGNTFPSGAIGISEEGRKQAERQQSIQGRFMPSNPAYKGVGARETGPVRYTNADYLTATPYINAFKRTFMGDGLQGNRFNPADRAAALGAGYTDSAIGVANFAKNRLVPFGKLAPNIPTLPKFKDENLQKLRGFGSVVIPALQTFGAANRLSQVGLGQEVGQMTLSNAAYNAGVRPTLTKTGITGVNPLTIAKAFTPEMLKTGPTAGGSAAILGTATALSAAQQAKASDTQTGGLNISGETPNTRRSLTSRALGAVDAVVGTDLDKLGGRTTPFGERLTSSIDSFGTLRKNMSDLGINMGGDLSLKGLQNTAKNISTTGKKLSMEDLAASTSFAKAFKDKPIDAVANLNPDGSKRVIKTLATLNKNKDVSEALANYGGEGFQKGLRDTASLVSDNYDKLSTDAKGNRKVISDMLMGNDPRSEFAKRFAFQQKENPQLSMQSKIKYASDPNFKQFTGKGFENKIKGINKKEMGFTGSLGNFVLSNQGRDVVTGNVPGTNNALDLASNIINTGRDPSSSTYDASQGFLKTIGAGGQPTPGSIIKGINPLPRFFRRGGSGALSSRSSGGGTAAPVGQLPQVQNPAEIPLPVIPQMPQQQGTQANTLSNIQNQSYQNTFNNLMAQFRPRTTSTSRRRNFRTSFNRDYFSQFV